MSTKITLQTVLVHQSENSDKIWGVARVGARRYATFHGKRLGKLRITYVSADEALALINRKLAGKADGSSQYTPLRGRRTFDLQGRVEEAVYSFTIQG